MCGKNDEILTVDENGNFQQIDLVTVSLENEYNPAILFRRIEDEAQHVPLNASPLSSPVWFDGEKFKKGQQYMYKNYYSMFVAKLCGLIVVLSVPSILKVLVLTGKSDTPAKAFRRYMDTIAKVLDWYSSDLNKDNSDSRNALFFVRGKHCAANKKAVTSGAGFISQRDLALTQYGFVGIAVLRGKELGMIGNDDELEGFIHFWRTIGYCMGIEDRFNICGGSLPQVTEVCDRLTVQVFKPYLEKPCENFNHMSKVMLEGMKPVVPSITPASFMEICRRNMGFEPKEVDGWFSKWMLALLLYIKYLLSSVWWVAVVLRPLLNWHLRFSFYCNIKLPLVPYLVLGKDVWRDNETKEFHHSAAVVS